MPFLSKRPFYFLSIFNSDIKNGRNIHPCLENPDGPWTHWLPDDHQWKIIINGRRSVRVRIKIENILEQLISGVVEETEKDRRNDSSDEDSDDDEEIKSEEEDQASGDCSDENEDDEVVQALSAHSCQFCNKLFSTKGNKEHHEKYVHKRDPISKRAYFCKLGDPECERFFSSTTSLWYHQLRAHGIALKCQKCSKEFTDFKEFVKHRRSERGDPELRMMGECSICKIPIKRLKRHMREVHDHENPIKNPLQEPTEKHHCCPHCRRKFKRLENMRRHIEEAHSLTNQAQWKCEQCEKSFTLERNLKLHKKRVHSQFPFFSTFNCCECEKSFKQKAHLKRHQKEQHGDGEMFSCPSCGKNFERKSNQERHSKNCKKLSKWEMKNCSVIKNCLWSTIKLTVCFNSGYFLRVYSRGLRRWYPTGIIKVEKLGTRFPGTQGATRHVLDYSGFLRTCMSIDSACIKVCNWKIDLHKDQTAEMVRTWYAFCVNVHKNKFTHFNTIFIHFEVHS